MGTATMSQLCCGARLKAKREARGESQIDPSKRVGIDRYQISRFENGASIGPESAKILAKALGEPKAWKKYWSRLHNLSMDE